MARLQQKRSGRKILKQSMDCASIRKALKNTLDRKGLAMPRFGEINVSKDKPS